MYVHGGGGGVDVNWTGKGWWAAHETRGEQPQQRVCEIFSSLRFSEVSRASPPRCRARPVGASATRSHNDTLATLLRLRRVGILRFAYSSPNGWDLYDKSRSYEHTDIIDKCAHQVILRRLAVLDQTAEIPLVMRTFPNRTNAVLT